MNLTNTRIFCERANFGRYINIHIGVEDQSGRFSVAKPLVFEDVGDGHMVYDHPPALRLDPTLAQTLADELWQAGFRPTQGQQSEGQMGATGKHLNDMRALVSALAKMELPK